MSTARRWRAVALVLAWAACLHVVAAGEAEPQVIEVARGHSWVSPYWGYNTPKVVCDGEAYYTAGLWGPYGGASGALYQYSRGAWRKGASLPGIYQPATLLLDRQGRLIVVYTRQRKPLRLLRGKKPGGIDSFEELSPPPDMRNAYYIGVAIREDTLFLVYLMDPDYSVYLARLDLSTLAWTPSVLVQQGQTESKPKTAWTYPVLYPTDAGLHLVASNCPDGGDGNTYNEVWHVFYPHGSREESSRERVAQCPMGHLAYALDMVVDDAGRVHVLYFWNRHVYGHPLPDGSPEEGTYHAWRDPDSGAWTRNRFSEPVYAGFFQGEAGLVACKVHQGGIARFRWDAAADAWSDAGMLCAADIVPAGPGFMDVLSRASGSDTRAGVAVVADGLMPEEADGSRERVVWSVLPGVPNAAE